ncbi:MAG: hypothetical protein H5T64_04690 [Chloroflexi bacterium]|nr:hypothetical protein [Chloroflexota bacterium]
MSTGFLGTKAGLVADVNLVAQGIMVLAILYGLIRVKQRAVSLHCNIMTTLAIVNGILIIGIMNPSFFRALPAARHNLAGVNLLLLGHAGLGALAEILAIYVVIKTRSNLLAPPSLRNTRTVMRVTWVLWLLNALCGGLLYALWYL